MTRISLVLAPEPTHPTAPQPPACSRLAWELPLRLLLSDHLDRWERGQRGGHSWEDAWPEGDPRYSNGPELSLFSYRTVIPFAKLPAPQYRT